MNHVDFEYFDCDNHFYETLDAFTSDEDSKLIMRDDGLTPAGRRAA